MVEHTHYNICSSRRTSSSLLRCSAFPYAGNY